MNLHVTEESFEMYFSFTLLIAPPTTWMGCWNCYSLGPLWGPGMQPWNISVVEQLLRLPRYLLGTWQDLCGRFSQPTLPFSEVVWVIWYALIMVMICQCISPDVCPAVIRGRPVEHPTKRRRRGPQIPLASLETG